MMTVKTFAKKGLAVLTCLTALATSLGTFAGPSRAVAAPTSASLTNTAWQWIETSLSDGKRVVPVAPENYVVEFMRGGRARGKADCNNFSGTYRSGGEQLSMEVALLTRQPCPPPSLVNTFVKELNSAAKYVSDSAALTITLKEDGGVMRLTAVAPPAAPASPTPAPSATSPAPSAQTPPSVEMLMDKRWQWTELKQADGRTLRPRAPQNYAIEFLAGGALGGRADCNALTGTYSTDGSLIKIDPAQETNKTCARGSLDNIFTTALSAAAVYHFDGADLVLDLFSDSGTMRFKGVKRSTQPTAATNGNAKLLRAIWSWSDTSLSDGTEIQSRAPQQFTVQFLPGSRLKVVADCNTATGTYTLKGTQLTIRPKVGMLKACEAGSQSGMFLQQLGNVANYKLDGDALNLGLSYDSGAMRFDARAAQKSLPAEGATPSPESQLATATIAPARVSADLAKLSSRVAVTLAKAVPYSNAGPPGPVGAPAHVALVVDGAEFAGLYPLLAWDEQWRAKGNSTINETVRQVQMILAERQSGKAPTPPVAVLPPLNARNDLACRFTHLDFGSGTGYRFIGRWAQDPSPVSNVQLKYVYQGISNDGQFFVSAIVPITSSLFPPAGAPVPTATLRLAESDFDAYIKGVRDACDAAPNEAFSPSLAALDAAVASISIGEPTGAVTPTAPSNTAPPQAQTDILGTAWKWESYRDSDQVPLTSEQSERYTLTFAPNGKFSARADCKRASGTYTRDGDALKLKISSATRVACARGSRDKKFLGYLAQIDSLAFDSDKLVLTLKNDAGEMQFGR